MLLVQTCKPYAWYLSRAETAEMDTVNLSIAPAPITQPDMLLILLAETPALYSSLSLVAPGTQAGCFFYASHCTVEYAYMSWRCWGRSSRHKPLEANFQQASLCLVVLHICHQICLLAVRCYSASKKAHSAQTHNMSRESKQLLIKAVHGSFLTITQGDVQPWPGPSTGQSYKAHDTCD